MLQAAIHSTPPSPHYGRAVRIAYLGNLIAVHFFTLAAPVILKDRHAPMGTLPLFASLALLWSLRAMVVPPPLQSKTSPLSAAYKRTFPAGAVP